ncbi:MAG: biotin/lipoate A/B protein ligase family protein [Promethearchaeota archaeon]
MAKWRLLYLDRVDPLWTQTVWHATALHTSENLDSALNTLIIEFTDGKLVSCGQSQNAYAEVNIDYCKANNILFTRRMTGGGVVLLDKGQVFYHVIFKGYHFPLKNKILYDNALKGPLKYLRSLGLNAQQDMNDIFIEDRKISGNGAASIESTGVVCGNIIADFDYKTCVETLQMPSNNFKDLYAPLLIRFLTTLKRELNCNEMNREDIAKDLIQAFEKALEVDFKKDELTEWEINKINELNEEYLTDKWIYMPEYFKDCKKEREFIKVTRGLGIIHFTEGFEADVIIRGKQISQIYIFDSEYAFLNQLTGQDIFEIKPYQDAILEAFRKKLIKYYYHTQ